LSAVYELVDYLAMVEDPVRTTAYLAAMRKTIREGDHVLELGTGFGFFAVAACRFGAAHVDAVEPNDAIALGPALAEANGCAGKITFHQMSSQQLALPRRADVLIEDLRGVSPLHLDRLGTLRDAHARLLTPDAHSIPRIDRLWCAASEWPDGGRPYQPTASAEVQGIDLGSVRRVAGDVMQRTHQGADALLTEGAEWSAVDLRDPSTAGTSGEVSLRVRRAGRCAAIVTWFSTELVEGIGYTRRRRARTPSTVGDSFR
jgi:type I protein arginine methyltransferase